MNKLFSFMLLGLMVLVPFGAIEAKKPAFAVAAQPGLETIVDIVLRDDGEFDILQAAVIRAGLVDVLNGNRPLTVFAPTDAAFVATLGVTDKAEALVVIEDLPIDVLTDILLYHVTAGKRVSSSVLGAPQYRMLNGAKLSQAELLEAGIGPTDIAAKNGVIHVIDSVLLP